MATPKQLETAILKLAELTGHTAAVRKSLEQAPEKPAEKSKEKESK